MNPIGHVMAASADEGIEGLWDVFDTFGYSVVVHSFCGIERDDERTRRFCVHLMFGGIGGGAEAEHPKEFRDNDLRRALLAAAVWLADELGDVMISTS